MTGSHAGKVPTPHSLHVKLSIFIAGLIACLPATLPRVYCDDLKYIFFPVVWLCTIICACFVAFLMLLINKKYSDKFIAFASGVFVGCGLLVLLGFNWTGDWLRFVLFQIGYGHAQLVHVTAPSEWRVYEWGGWGFAGDEGESYLVFDPTHRLSHLNEERRISGLSCPVADSRPMWPSWYLVITYNCDLS